MSSRCTGARERSRNSEFPGDEVIAELPMSERVPTYRLRVEADFDRLTHYLFRYPAKFHPPVVRALLERYTGKGECVFDPFCGSGTLLVEASVLGRPSIGLDVDPVAVAVTGAKVHRYQGAGRPDMPPDPAARGAANIRSRPHPPAPQARQGLGR